jgi:uncharacterized protein (DUF1778 family)
MMQKKERGKMEKPRTYTKERMIFSSFRLLRRDVELITVACAMSGTSRSEFLRQALREKALRLVQRKSVNQ